MQKKIVSLCAGKARGIYKDMPGEVLDFLLLEVALRLMVLSPALFLLTDQWKFLALLCIPLFLLVVPFARERAAENMQDALSGGHLFSGNLVSFSGYFGSFVFNVNSIASAAETAVHLHSFAACDSADETFKVAVEFSIAVIADEYGGKNISHTFLHVFTTSAASELIVNNSIDIA